MSRSEWEVADIFRRHGPSYRARVQLSKPQYKAMRAIEQCRTAALGGHIDECTECGHRRISYNSCRNRHCPKCQWSAREAWIEKRREELLPVGYFHLVFTLPGELHDLLAYNAGLLYGELFSQGWQSLEQLCRDGRYLGARPGMIAVLHTWGQNLHYHPHIHCIVPAGGIRGKEKWINSRKKFFVPVRALSRLFRGKFVSALRRHYKAGALRLSGLCRKYLDKRQFDRLLHLVMSKEWVVYAKEPFAGPEHLFGYLGRYSHRVAISNHRIVSVNETRVQFRYRDYADGNKEKVTALSPQEFIRRFLQHILPDGFCKIRYYGILSNRHRRQSVQICRKALGVAPPPPKPSCKNFKIPA
jgi:hypothetical protein